MDKQIEEDSGQMFMHLASVPTEEAQRTAYVQELEEKAAKAVQAIQEALETEDDQKFKAASAECCIAQETWLVISQHMTKEQARAVMVDFAQSELTRWMQERVPGPPPLIFDRFK